MQPSLIRPKWLQADSKLKKVTANRGIGDKQRGNEQRKREPGACEKNRNKIVFLTLLQIFQCYKNHTFPPLPREYFEGKVS